MPIPSRPGLLWLLFLVLSPALRAAETEPLVRGPSHPALTSFDALMTGFLADHQIPGAALAVARDGRLLYARGFGLADRNAADPVQPGSLFRIASISKPVTAAAVLRLVEQGRLNLDDRVFDLLNLESKVPPNSQLDPRWREINLRQLLQHTGGWDRDASFDPMFRAVPFAREFNEPPPAAPDTIIRAMLARPLDFDPGTRYAYSNFGYCLLGRVLETATGLPYDQAVQREVLDPLGIHAMRLGRTRPEHRAPGEVRYYSESDEPDGRSVFEADLGQPVSNPYGAWNLEAMDAHGGWIASAIDLARFGSRLDDLLAPDSMNGLVERPEGLPGHEPDGSPRSAYYGYGWMVRPISDGGRFNTWHSGSLPGTSTLLVRRHDGLCWAVLFNTRHSALGENPAGAIDSRLHQAAAAVDAWPEFDLFAVALLPWTAILR